MLETDGVFMQLSALANARNGSQNLHKRYYLIKKRPSFDVAQTYKNSAELPLWDVWRAVVELLLTDRMSITDHSPTTGVVTIIVILIAIAALGALILGCWCYLRLQRISQSEDEESIVGEGETKEPFLLVQYSAKGPRVEHKTKLTPNGTENHT